MLSAFFRWFDEFFAYRDEFGLTDHQRNRVLSIALRGEQGRDHAEELACHAYGLRTSQYLALLNQNSISTK